MFAGRHGDGGARAQQAAARLAGGWRPRRRAEAEGRAEGWWSKRKLRTTTRKRRRAARAPGPSQVLSLPGCRRMDGASSGGGGSSEGGGGSSGSGCKCSLHKPSLLS